MTANLTAVPEAITAFGEVEALVSSQLITAGAVNIAAVTAMMTPVFGLLGAEHLAATIMAMTTNTFEVGQLAAVHAGHAVAAFGSAANYTAADAHHASEVLNIGKLI
ncbi:hypothetical protein GOARA_091_00300 [Gordonia araii NBRC 100433]|uniref:PE domain-containing protein n=1 Tax=Gordonia araii NBRC 100433 TaxID=1073574 RepID=G7H7T7_9ACTN|nr:type VII secretion target [Gordonia araii]NNG95647.1 hypothetical protein [Gordonia araii NBRC 100433]GAB11912.1 hypothetical protein GOARA_091_00300 [Gordonia araii NBRC 100433]